MKGVTVLLGLLGFGLSSPSPPIPAVPSEYRAKHCLFVGPDGHVLPDQGESVTEAPEQLVNDYR